MKKLFFICNKANGSSDTFKIACKNLNIKLVILELNGFSFQNNLIFYKKKLFQVNSSDKIIIRDFLNFGSTSGINKAWIIKYISKKYYNNIIIDRDFILHCLPDFEDKLFAANFFYENGISVPKTTFFNDHQNVETKYLKFPILAKQRISSLNKGNFSLENEENLINFVSKHKNDIDNYIFQQKVDFLREYRITIFKNEVLSSIEKKIIIEDKIPKLKMLQTGFKPSKKSLLLSSNLSKLIKCDLIGIDLIETKNGDSFLIEANFSPALEPILLQQNINIAAEVLKRLKL